MSTSQLLIIGRTLVSEVAARATFEGIKMIDEKLDFYVKRIKKEKRGE